MGERATKTVTVRIEGRVQGVCFRAWTYETAQSLGLDGTVRNMSDGSVEAVFSGSAERVNKMIRLCHDGPKDAGVTKVTILDEGGAVAPGFKVIASDRWR
ncbi:MAG TPA: acylphosphatase [Methyloceanibacter sp.]|jgi:acylphosphatase